MNLTKKKSKPDWTLEPHLIWKVIIYGILATAVIHITCHELNMFN